MPSRCVPTLTSSTSITTSSSSSRGYDRLQTRIHALYVDQLDGKVEKTTFNQLSGQWRKEQHRLLEDIAFHGAADQTYLDEGARLLDLAANAKEMFARQEPFEKRRMLNFVLSNSTRRDGTLMPERRQPFDLLAETAARSGGNSERR